MSAPQPDCLFCRIVAGEIPSTRVHDDDQVVAIRDIAPRAPTHILLITRRHIPSAADLVEADGPLLGRVFAVAAELARSEGIADGGYRLDLERRSLGWPDGGPSPRPPDGRSLVQLAARVTRTRRRLAGLASSVAVAVALAACATSESGVPSVPVEIDRSGDDRVADGEPDPGRARSRAGRQSAWS